MSGRKFHAFTILSLKHAYGRSEQQSTDLGLAPPQQFMPMVKVKVKILFGLNSLGPKEHCIRQGPDPDNEGEGELGKIWPIVLPHISQQ